MSEKENRLLRVDPTGEGSTLQFSVNQALNKRESFLSGATGAKLANSKPGFARNRNSNKSNHLSRGEHTAHSKASLLSLQQVQHRFGHTQHKSFLRQKSSGEHGCRVNSTGAHAKPATRLAAQYAQAARLHRQPASKKVANTSHNVDTSSGSRKILRMTRVADSSAMTTQLRNNNALLDRVREIAGGDVKDKRSLKGSGMVATTAADTDSIGLKASSRGLESRSDVSAARLPPTQKKSVSQTQAKLGTSSIKAAVSRRLASPPVQGFHCSIKVSSPKLVDRKTKLRKFREHVKSHAATGQLF